MNIKKISGKNLIKDLVKSDPNLIDYLDKDFFNNALKDKNDMDLSNVFSLNLSANVDKPYYAEISNNKSNIELNDSSKAKLNIINSSNNLVTENINDTQQNKGYDVAMKINKPTKVLKEDKSKNASDEQILKQYKKFACLTEDAKINEIDDWAFSATANKFNCNPQRLREMLLKEDTLEKAAKDLEAETIVQNDGEHKSQIEKALDKSLKRAKAMKGARGDFPNILLIGDAGFSKTAATKEWAQKNGINLVYKDAKTMNPADLGGIVARDADDPRYATRLGSSEFAKSLSKPNSVLFLDEYNRAKQEMRGSLLTLVQDHVIWDPNAEGEQGYLENFLFTVAAINPANSAYAGAKPLDPAERSRFKRVQIIPDPSDHLAYLRRLFKEKIANAADEEDKLENEGRLAIAETLLNDASFEYDSSDYIEENADDPNYIPLNYRSLTQALLDSDGTKKDFLDVWSEWCNYNKKGIVETILSDYVDVKDKATDAIADASESDVFAKTKTNREKLKAKFAGLKI